MLNDLININFFFTLYFRKVSIYMKDQLTSELCYEEYENVAVMFATIRNYDTEQVGMRVLNEIICDFDEVVSEKFDFFLYLDAIVVFKKFS